MTTAHRHGEHVHEHDGHGHSHGLIDESIKRSRTGLRAVAVSLLVLGLTAAVQTLVFLASGSVALLADLIHNLRRYLRHVRRYGRSTSPSRPWPLRSAAA